MAIAARTATYANDQTAATTLVLTEPSGAAENDVLFAMFQFDNYFTDFVSGPSGWTLLNTWTGAAFQEARLYWIRRGSGALDTAARTFTVNAGSYWKEGEMLAFSGCLTSGNPWDDAQYAAQGDAFAPNPPSATSSGADRVAVCFGATWSYAQTNGATAPTNYTVTRSGNDGDGIFSAYRAVGSGAEDPGAFGNVNGEASCSAATIILTPAGAGGIVIPTVVRHLQNMMRA